ncbi:glycoside hydrolase family 3 protein [Steroidobacter flavus]|uniref:beta-N-acetylhexosaminidase n=1 Tax=Steroidobacter flavus TaxID=1842136 RepID=A0ABV8SW95_9GAMM
MSAELTFPTASTPNPLSISAEAQAWVNRTRDNLSVEQQIAQLFVLSSREDTDAEIDELCGVQPGGIHRFPTESLDRAWYATREVMARSEVPMLLSGDIEGGTISYPFCTQIPNQMGIAACDDLALTEALARVLAVESRALGYNWSLTPVVDINRAFRSALIGTRSYGSNVDKIIEHGCTHVRTLQAHGLAATAKHWPGDGLDDRDQHVATTVNSQTLDEWMQTFGRIFRALIDQGVASVMSAHIAFPAFIRSMLPNAGRSAFEPASVSKLLNEELLRNRLGFRGLIVSDSTAMGGLTSWMDRATAVPAVIENGCDVFLFSRNAAGDMKHMLDGLRAGRLSERRLNEAVTRVLTFKASLGLHTASLESRLAPLEQVRAQLQTVSHRAVAREAAGRSLTLVKDTQQLLPLDPTRHRRVVIISDAGSNFFAGAPARSFAPLCDELTRRGFEVRAFDPHAVPTRENADLVLYVLGQEATPTASHIYIDFAKLHAGGRNAMRQFNRELPTMLISFGQPYFLYDAPNFQTYVNGYCSLADQQIELARRLVGEASFSGVSPVDAFCGLEQLRW